jgi:hypothetical protein
MIRSATCAALVLALTAVAPARAEAPETTTDLKCLAFAFNLSSDADQAKASVGTMAALYFLGRIDGREPGLNLEKRLVQPDLQIKPGEVAGLGVKCGGMLQARGRELTTMAERLKPAGQ